MLLLKSDCMLGLNDLNLRLLDQPNEVIVPEGCREGMAHDPVEHAEIIVFADLILEQNHS